ncbi:hypothetical protein GCK72_011248 [Caenorhabditis remanei]|uniref:Uncharacterized protein n=1 Tax=Caenorhabditis remanei TaxID=31234 RepID=A0A6A5H974_CAERE|nr:hypothetical protein GCK72_011248 [Caenorhabditis remanei]KAF1762983.1 hypothetical protein GCK72_011248 [Caenorhabditis remanei]
MTSQDPYQLVAKWNVPVGTEVHNVILEHNISTGNKLLRVDGTVIVKQNSILTRVGDHEFPISNLKALLSIKCTDRGDWVHTLSINGMTFKDYKNGYYQNFTTWKPEIAGREFLITFEKHRSEVYVDGTNIRTTRRFVECGTSTIFHLHRAFCEIIEQGVGGRTAMTQTLSVDNTPVPVFKDKEDGVFIVKPTGAR